MHGHISAYQFDSGASVSATGSTQTAYTIPDLSNGERPKYILVSCLGAAGVKCAVGNASVAAQTTPHFAVSLGQSPVPVNMTGQTTLDIDNTDAGAQVVVVGLLANY